MKSWTDFFKNVDHSYLSEVRRNDGLIATVMENLPDNGTVLEAGCGTANLGILLADRGYKVTCGDISDDVLEMAKTRVFPAVKEKVTFKKVDLLDMFNSLGDEKFDVITHSGVMEHFEDDKIVQSLSQQKNIAKVVVFKIPNSRTKFSKEFHFGDERFMPNSKWVELIKQAGFLSVEVLGTESVRPIFHLLPRVVFMQVNSRTGVKGKLIRSLRSILKYMSRHTIFICRP